MYFHEVYNERSKKIHACQHASFAANKKNKTKKLHLNHTFMNEIFQLKIFIDLYLLGIK